MGLKEKLRQTEIETTEDAAMMEDFMIERGPKERQKKLIQEIDKTLKEQTKSLAPYRPQWFLAHKIQDELPDYGIKVKVKDRYMTPEEASVRILGLVKDTDGKSRNVWIDPETNKPANESWEEWAHIEMKTLELTGE